MQVWCAVPTPEKFIVQLSAVVICQAGLHRKCLAFFEGGGSLSANI